MRLRHHLLLLVALAAVALSGPLVACDGGGTECECGAAGLTVTLPAALVGQLTSIAPSGPACTGATVNPPPARAGSAASFQVEPTRPGACHVDLYFSDGTTFSDDVTVVETTGCCAGLRTTPPGAADIAVPAPLDAGA